MKLCYLLCLVLCLVMLTMYSILKDLKIIKVTKMDMKYILLWTSPDSEVHIPFVYMGKGQECFKTRKCLYDNCYVTTDKTFLGSSSNFDVIVFSGTELADMYYEESYFPKERSMHQKYAYANIESAAIYRMYINLDEYFNWTWTYRLDSDIRWGYIVVRDLENNIIGPRKDMNWLKLADMDPVPEEFKLKLKNKRRAAAWFVSNCETKSRREIFVNGLQQELLKYKLVLDVYGKCGLHECSRDNEDFCDKKIESEYYFYLSFENALSEDYVTEKLLRALKNNAIPVVYGGANYTRFMPNGIYLNALELGVKKLAAKMNELIKDPDKYSNYFKWKNHYKYEKTSDSVETNEYCRMCKILNDKELVKKTTIYKDFNRWWNLDDADTSVFSEKINSALGHYREKIKILHDIILL